jgi:hypothetical protein
MADRIRKAKPRDSSKRAPRPTNGPGQVGRRPSPPALLFAIAASWIGVGIIALVELSASWKLIPAIVFIGIGLMYLRGALTTVVRRDEQ